MSTINQLSTIEPSTVTSSDNFVLYSNQNGDARKLSAANLLEYVRTNLTDSDYITTITTPGDGFNISIEQDGQDRWALLRPTTSLATGQIVLPSDTVAVDGQQILVTTTYQVAAFTLTASSSIEGAPTVLAAGDCFTMRFNSQTNTWYKVA